MRNSSQDCTLGITDEVVVLSNGLISISFNTRLGLLTFTDLNTGNDIFSRGYTQVQTDQDRFDSRDMTYKAISTLDFEDDMGRGKAVVIRLQDPDTKCEMNLKLSVIKSLPCYMCSVQFKSRSDKELRIKSINPFVLDVDDSSRLMTGWNGRRLRFFKNGFHSWELSQAVPIEIGENTSHFYTVVNDTETKKALVLGFVTLADQLSTISAYGREDEESRLERLEASSLCDDILLLDNETIVSEELFVIAGDHALELLALYVEIVSKRMKALGWDKVPQGWCSWYFYFTTPDEKEIESNAQALKEVLPGHIEWIQIDDGYQKTVGDWTENDRFKNGLNTLVKKVNELGFKAGIWIAPFIVSEHSDLFKNEQDWFVKDIDGRFSVVGENPLWLGKFYALDLTHPEVISHIESVFKKLKEEGFEYFKIDFLYHAGLKGVRHNQKMTRGQTLRSGLEAIRRAVGDAFILGCGAPIGPCIGIVNAMRIGNDIATVWKYDWGGGVYQCAINTMSRAILHDRWWINDGDCVLVRQDDSNLTLDEIKLWLSVVALSGGSIMLSDRIMEVSKERIHLLEKILPAYRRGGIALDSLVEAEPRLFALPIETPMGRWAVVAAINLTEKPIGVSFSLNEIGLNEHALHHVFSFWDECYEGLVEGKIEIMGLKPHSCRLLCIKPTEDIPDVLSTSMHFTQGAVELSHREWNPDERALRVSVTRTTNEPKAIFFVFEGNWTPERAYVSDEQVKIELIAPEVIAIRHQFKQGQIVRIEFAK
ncbi:MAG: alpha-galactosidase [Candidatus Thorarchaeota archaeon]